MMPMLGADHLQPKLTAIPAYMPVTFNVAKGFKYGTDADFQHFGKELQNAIQRFEKMPLTLCTGKSRRMSHVCMRYERSSYWNQLGHAFSFFDLKN